MEMKSLRIDPINYLFEIPYGVSQKSNIAIIDMINHPNITSKNFWNKILGDDIQLLYSILIHNTDNEKLLESIVNYYFTDKILRKINLIPEYINYDKLVEGSVEGDMINSDVWRIHIQYLYDLRTVSRVTLNNHRISATKMMNTIKKTKTNIPEEVFNDKIKWLIIRHPRIVTNILMYIPQDKVIESGGKENFLKALHKTKKDLHQKLISFKHDSKLTTANREAVYHVHEEMNYVIEEFKIIEHIVDYITISSVINTTVYKPIYKIIINLIASLEKIEKLL